MKRATAEEYRQTISSFVDVDDDEPALPVVDRSTLEAYTVCVAQARFIDSGIVLNSSLAMASGEEVHQAISKAITAYVDSHGVLSTADVRSELEAAVYAARPDVQPDAIRGLMRSVWGIAEYVTKRHPDNILRWDGGDGDRCGQIAADIGRLCRYTSEVDFLCTTPSKDVLEESDWKSGWKRFSIDGIADSFQFQSHAWLALSTYPEIQALQVKVWLPRQGRCQYPVTFARKDMPKWTARIRAAVALWHEHRLTLPTEAPAWPAVEKCRLCAAAIVCPKGRSGGLVATNPVLAVDNLIAMQAGVEALETNLRAYVDEYGPVQGTGGDWFGVRPPSGRKTWGVYSEQAGNGEQLTEANGEVHES